MSAEHFFENVAKNTSYIISQITTGQKLDPFSSRDSFLYQFLTYGVMLRTISILAISSRIPIIACSVRIHFVGNVEKTNSILLHNISGEYLGGWENSIHMNTSKICVFDSLYRVYFLFTFQVFVVVFFLLIILFLQMDKLYIHIMIIIIVINVV